LNKGLLSISVTVFAALSGLFAVGILATGADATVGEPVPAFEDAKIVEDAPDQNYSNAPILAVDTSKPVLNNKALSALVRWDLSGIAPGTKIASASVTLSVIDPSPATFRSYALKRRWKEAEVTWNSYAAGLPWEVAGAKGSLDREAQAAGTITPSAPGDQSFALSAEVVQRWVDNRQSNQGIVIDDSGKDDGFTFASGESVDMSLRPRLTLQLESSETTCESSWRRVPSANELRSPQAIEPIAPNDIWIVGGREVAGVAGVTTGTEHWDGRRWEMVPSPNLGTGDNMLLGVDAVSSTDVWAVGHSAPSRSSPYDTLAERWDGSQWEVVQSPNPGMNSNALTGVDALGPNVAWAVGYYREGELQKTLLQRWDGDSWNVVPSPNPGTFNNALLSVTAIAPDNIWAVGWKSSRTSGPQSLVLHYDGVGWNEIPAPTVGTGDNVLTSVSAVAGDDVWAAGYYIDGTQYKTLTLHYDGTAWEHVPSAGGEDGVAVLRGIDAFSPTDAWAVGLEYQADQNRYIASTQRWNGSSWTTIPSAVSQASSRPSDMFAVAKAPGTSQVWAAGQNSNVETICPLESTSAPSTTSETSDSSAGSSAEALQPASATSPGTEALSTALEVSAGPIEVTASDKALEAGVSEVTQTFGSIITDFDNDGLKDIFLSRHIFAGRLYLNDGNGHFTEKNPGMFGRGNRHRCDAADVNNDGLKDIFCPSGSHYGTLAKRNELYIQQPNHTFVDRAGQYGVLDPFSRATIGKFIEANGDGYPDLFAGAKPDRGDGLPSLNRLFVNRAGTEYRYAPSFGLGDGLRTGGGSGDVGDLDKDGWQDLVVLGSGLRVYHNEQGNGFTEVGKSVGLNHWPNDVTLADVNGDTWLDVIEVWRHSFEVRLNDKDGTFSLAFSAPLEYGQDVAAGDVNGDDRPDIYVMQGGKGGLNLPDQAYLNDGTGRSFSQMLFIPSTSEGAAESVSPLDYDGNGLTDFLVLNGEGSNMGPVQLIAFFPVGSKAVDTQARP
jgi:hypothetical protein